MIKRLTVLRAREGFTLGEMLVALALTAVVGAAVTGLFVSQSQFFDRQEKSGFARDVSRSAMTIIMSELRMIEQDSGVVVASDSLVTLRVPFAMGIVCGVDAAGVDALLLPVATELYNDAVTNYTGYMWRPLDTDTYTYVGTTTAPSLNPAGATATCTAAGLATANVTGSQTMRVTPTAAATVRAPIMLYQNISYRFAESTSVPGRLALYRQAGTGANEELVAPFDTTARFRFYWGTERGDAQDSPPADLSDLFGIQIVLDAVSERPAADGTYTSVPLSTSVFFKNRQ